MKKFTVILFHVVAFALSVLSESNVEDNESFSSLGSGSYSFVVEHSFDQGKTFSQRGSLSIHSLRSNTAVYEPTVSLSDFESNFKSLCEADDLYRIRLKGSSGVVHKAVLPACSLIKSKYYDVFTLYMDWRGTIVSLSVMPGEASNTKTKANVNHMEPGPQPDTASFIQKIEQDKLAKQRGETKDNRSFIAKYWMYIIPVVLVFAMGSGGQEGGR